MLLVFSVGPVQGLIAQARRTSDGWVGSFLLSYLAAHAVRELMDGTAAATGRTLLEPDLDSPLLHAVRSAPAGARSVAGDTTVASLPNTVLVQLSPSDDPSTIVDALARSVQDAWTRVTEAIWSALLADLTGRPAVRTLWESQTSTIWELTSGWGNTSREAYIALASRKALRDVVAPDEIGERCTVVADRVALWDRDDRRAGERMGDCVKRQWRAWSALIRTAGALDGAPESLFKPDGRERLSAPALVRRLIPYCENPIRRTWYAGRESPRMPFVFPSTSTVAVATYRAQLVEAAMLDEELAGAVHGLIGAVGGLGGNDDPLDQFARNAEATRAAGTDWRSRDLAERALRLDGDWYLYGDAVRNEFQTLRTDRARDEALRRAVRSLRQAAVATARRLTGLEGDDATTHTLADPPIYYALLAMDGDAMGDFLGLIADRGIPTSTVSGILGRFAIEAGRLVRESNGRLIYAGGDDVVALVPVVTDPDRGATVLDAADRIRVAFRDAFEEWRRIHWRDEFGIWTQRSQSAAIMLTHHQAPLGAVLGGAQAVLKEWAKRRAGRDAVAFQVLRRGGASITCAVKWGPPAAAALAGGATAAELFRMVASAMDRDDVSTGLAHRLRSDRLLLGATGPFAGRGDATDPRVRWIRTILEKSGLQEGGKAPVLDSLARSIAALCIGAVGDDLDSAADFSAGPALIARFLAGGGREARE